VSKVNTFVKEVLGELAKQWYMGLYDGNTSDPATTPDFYLPIRSMNKYQRAYVLGRLMQEQDEMDRSDHG
jgi:hypothetical protein